jgi:hypothetical protein
LRVRGLCKRVRECSECEGRVWGEASEPLLPDDPQLLAEDVSRVVPEVLEVPP